MAIKTESRKQVYNKYNGRCAYCGRGIAYKDMQVDHLIPQRMYEEGKAEGDMNDMSNLMPSCRTCNHYKRANSLEHFRESIENIPKKLGEREYIYKVGMAYGFYSDKPQKVKFYFEQPESEVNR